MIWQKIAGVCAHLECLAFTAPAWGRPILYREIASLERFALHIMEPAEADGPEIPAFFLRRAAEMMADLHPLAALLRRAEAGDWMDTIEQLQNFVVEVDHGR